jgi:predicted AlkP superfamily phosphohydrolase/phosphomutase
VKAVHTSTELYGPDHHPDLPDLLVAFRTDLGQLKACESPTTGRIEAAFTPGGTRSGDHLPHSKMWVVAPDGRVAVPRRANVLDIAPTVLSLLGVPHPEGLDGTSLVAPLAG